MNLYQFLNRRHHDKAVARINDAIDRISSGEGYVSRSWEEMEAHWAERAAREDAQPRVVKAARRARIWLFGFNGMLTVRLRPRNLVNGWVWSRQRSRRGWCDSDCWNTDGYFTTMLAGMLRHMAEHGHAYPGFPPFETPEKWGAHLLDLSERLRGWTEDDAPPEALDAAKAALREFADGLSLYWD